MNKINYDNRTYKDIYYLRKLNLYSWGLLVQMGFWILWYFLLPFIAIPTIHSIQDIIIFIIFLFLPVIPLLIIFKSHTNIHVDKIVNTNDELIITTKNKKKYIEYKIEKQKIKQFVVKINICFDFNTCSNIENETFIDTGDKILKIKDISRIDDLTLPARLIKISNSIPDFSYKINAATPFIYEYRLKWYLVVL